MNLIAKNLDEVGKKPIDFQSFNHIIFGFVSYIIVFFLIRLFFEDQFGFSAFISLLIAVVWEILENKCLCNSFFRKWGKDSLENSLADIIFNFIGISLACFLSIFFLEYIIIIGFVIIVVLVLLMYIFNKMIQNEE